MFVSIDCSQEALPVASSEFQQSIHRFRTARRNYHNHQRSSLHAAGERARNVLTELVDVEVNNGVTFLLDNPAFIGGAIEMGSELVRIIICVY